MTHELYMRRCIQLALNGAGKVAPNPMVGAVLVNDERIIGEGWHRLYGEAHAEVNCLASVSKDHQPLISESTMYVTLEPCAHHGKTPPCADLIIRHRIPRVVIGCRDPFVKVDGKGIEKLKAAGVEVTLDVLEEECRELNRRFMTFHLQHRPYIILKWAQTANGRISSGTNERLLISNDYSNRLVHRWRSEEAAILIGTHTAQLDDPELTTRLWNGPSPVRLVIDKELQLPTSLKIFNDQTRTIIFNLHKHEEQGNLLYYQVTESVSMVHQILHALYQMNIQSVLVEGGAFLLQSFIDEQTWDEIRRIENSKLTSATGLAAPSFCNAHKQSNFNFGSDTIEIFRHQLR
jgi:diaminohydroxyphosphoribosylaminopyrimidine deaminase / 5-amino-6-(5-phosphoribosylamino)uracil reductase